MADISVFPVPYEKQASPIVGVSSFKSRRFSFFQTPTGDVVSNQDSSKQSIINQVLTTLFTSRGDIPTNRNSGTNLRSLLQSYDITTAFEDVALSLLEAEQQIKRAQAGVSNSSGTQYLLHRLELTAVDTSVVGQLRIQIKIVTRSGEQIPIEV